MAFALRRLVSTNKRRYQQHGYDLDLSYITSRIIAMGFPCHGVSRLYRNPLDDVVRLLEERHGGQYKVYNLCVERGYEPQVFKGRVMRVPMYDGQAPPLHLMLDVCRDAAAWLAAHPAHVVAIHCKAGKGRTGAVVCALLLALDPNLGGASLDKTLALWAERRTRDGKGLSIPSQRRFVCYFQQMLLVAGTTRPGPEPAANGVADGASDQGQQPNSQQASLPQSLAQQQQQQQPAPQCQTSPQPAEGALRLPDAPVLPRLLAAATVPAHAVRLVCLRFRGLPPWLLRDCTASVWWRPVGHYEAHALCHVSTRATVGGCSTGSAPDDAVRLPVTGGAAWAIRLHDAGSSAGGGGGGGGGRGASPVQELCIDLTGLAPLPAPPPPPAPLPYYNPPGGGGLMAESRAPDAAGCDKPGPPMVAGDIKVQLFRGALADPPHDVFKGSATQFSAWVCTSYLDPRVGLLELGRSELDKLSKRLRRWPGAVGIVLEYDSLAR